jgi:hypothetical protein
MPPSFLRESAFCDNVFNDMAMMLTENRDRPTYRRELLQPELLDFSHDSLHHLDDFVHTLHQEMIPSEELTRMSLRMGAYVGEVIRLNCTEMEFHWLDYQDAANKSAAVNAAGMSVQVAAVLWAEDADRMCFPIAKVCKYLEDRQPDESLYAYARLAISRQQRREEPLLREQDRTLPGIDLVIDA